MCGFDQNSKRGSKPLSKLIGNVYLEKRLNGKTSIPFSY
jgi:hypothetical protein